MSFMRTLCVVFVFCISLKWSFLSLILLAEAISSFWRNRSSFIRIGPLIRFQYPWSGCPLSVLGFAQNVKLKEKGPPWRLTASYFWCSIPKFSKSIFVTHNYHTNHQPIIKTSDIFGIMSDTDMSAYAKAPFLKIIIIWH